jgi:UDP-2,3-diacylglucosamine pyrophosphatase LpxH
VDGRAPLELRASHHCSHGDEFDGVTRYHRWIAKTGDRGYEALLTINRWFNRARRMLGFPYWSLSAYLKWKVKRAVDFACDFERSVAREAARRGMQGVVCGHVHRATMHEAHGVLYCNTGDWVESCTSLIEHLDGSLELVAFGTEVPAVAALPGRDPVPAGR